MFLMFLNFEFQAILFCAYFYLVAIGVVWENFGDPVLLRDKVKSWNLEAWALKNIRSVTAGNITNIYLSTTPYFAYHNNYAYTSKYMLETYECTYEIKNMTPQEFFLSHKNLFRYYSGNIMNPTFDNLRKFVDPRSLIDDRSVTGTIWIGDKGVRATAHYDDAHNVYVQLSGNFLSNYEILNKLLYREKKISSVPSCRGGKTNDVRKIPPSLQTKSFHRHHHKFVFTLISVSANTSMIL